MPRHAYDQQSGIQDIEDPKEKIRAGNQDITDRKPTKSALKESERKWRLMLENFPALLCYIDREQRCLFLSNEYARLLNKPVGEMVGKYVWEVLGEQAYAATRDKIARVLAGEQVDYHLTLFHVANGPRHFAGRLMPDVSPEGEISGYYTLMQDISEVKALEQESRQLRERLAHLDRVATVHAMTSSIAHEINQPLSAILSNAQALLRYLDLGRTDCRETGEILQDIVSDVKRASDIIGRVRCLLRREEFPGRKVLNIKDLVLDVLKLTQSEFTIRNSRVETDFADDLPAIFGDLVQIQQVLINFLFNALDALDHCPPAERHIRVAAWKDAAGVCFSVTDSGPGMDPEKLELCLEPFYTSKREGLGLGLPICRYIIKDHGGRMWVELTEEMGFRAVVCLPAVFEDHTGEPHVPYNGNGLYR